MVLSLYGVQSGLKDLYLKEEIRFFKIDHFFALLAWFFGIQAYLLPMVQVVFVLFKLANRLNPIKV